MLAHYKHDLPKYTMMSAFGLPTKAELKNLYLSAERIKATDLELVVFVGEDKFQFDLPVNTSVSSVLKLIENTVEDNWDGTGTVDSEVDVYLTFRDMTAIMGE